jgi:hypothetical protein
MTKARLIMLILAALLATATPIRAVSCMWPDYENTARSWGRVVTVDSTISSGVPWVAFTLRIWTPTDVTTPTGATVRLECGTNAVSLGCDQIRTGDSVLVSGHSVGYPSCRVDGVDDAEIPNVIYRCQDHLPGSCQQITPCS